MQQAVQITCGSLWAPNNSERPPTVCSCPARPAACTAHIGLAKGAQAPTFERSVPRTSERYPVGMEPDVVFPFLYL